MLTPSIHLNGTAGQDLLDQIDGVARALRATIEAMADAAPNARDYYPQGDDAYYRARNAHQNRAGRIREMLKEYEALAESISDEMETQAARKRRA